jgi:enediyne biosynthesis protein E4
MLYPGSGSLPFTAPSQVAWEAQRVQFDQLKITDASVVSTGDIDGDGDLDVFVAQYRPPYVGGQLPTPYYDANDGFASYLLLNDGRGKFEQAKNQPALRGKSHRRTLSASLVDLDGDSDLDLVTLNDYNGVDLFYNDGKGNFTDETARLDNRHLFGMGLAFADFDRDGTLDFLATGMNIATVHRLDSMKLAPPEFPDRTARRMDMAYGNRLYTLRDGKWIQPPWAHQLARSGWTWGVSTFDFDNNGALDVYTANGHVSGESIADYDSLCWTRDIYLGSSRENPELQRYFDVALRGLNSGKTSWAGYQHNTFFIDVGTNNYVNAAFLMGVAHESDCRAVVSADFNEDGRPDLVVTEAKWQGTPNIMRHRLLVHLNQIATGNHWIGVRLARRDGPVTGAKVIATTQGESRMATIVTGDSFQSQQPAAVHFGLGPELRVTRLEVIWPDGKRTLTTNASPDRWHVISR